MASASRSERVKLSRIVQYPLLPEDVKKLEGLKATDAEVFAALTKIIMDGWFLDVTEDRNGDGFVILVKQGNRESASVGFGFYAKGDTLKAAFVCAIYKIELLGTTGIESFLSGRSAKTSFG